MTRWKGTKGTVAHRMRERYRGTRSLAEGYKAGPTVGADWNDLEER